MKNIYEILADYGLEIPEEKKADFDKAWKENYRTKAEYDKAAGDGSQDLQYNRVLPRNRRTRNRALF